MEGDESEGINNEKKNKVMQAWTGGMFPDTFKI